MARERESGGKGRERSGGRAGFVDEKTGIHAVVTVCRTKDEYVFFLKKISINNVFSRQVSGGRLHQDK